jgi:hypothetical protein
LAIHRDLTIAGLFHSFLLLARQALEEFAMRNVINTTANVTTNAIVNRTVRTVLAGVDAMRASSAHHVRLYNAAPAPQGWSPAMAKQADGQKPFAGKQKPAAAGLPVGGCGLQSKPRLQSSELSRCSRRETSRCRRPRVSSCLARS